MTQDETSAGAVGRSGPAPSPAPAAHSQIGRYKILRELGRGAMGVVYLAQDPKIGRSVALKVLHDVQGISPQELEEFRSRFFREARTAGMLSHRNIVVIHDVDHDEKLGITYMAMELLKGQSVRDLARSGVKFTTDQAIDVVTQVAEGLDHAHRQGIVHRDVKPDNLMYLEDGTVKITDFGIAKISTSNLTRTGQFIGTPNYMSPEQVIGHVIDGRSDLFSLGIILYELLTGEKPFMGSSLTTITYQIVNVDPIEPSKIRPGIPKIFDQVTAKLLRKAPDERFQTGKEVSEALRSIRDGGSPSSSGGGPRPGGTPISTGAPGAGDATQVSTGAPTPAAGGVPTLVTAGGPQPAAAAGQPERAGSGKLVIGGIAAVIVIGAAIALFALLRKGPEAAPTGPSGTSVAATTTTAPVGGTTAPLGASAPLGPESGATGASAPAGASGATAPVAASGATAPMAASGATAPRATGAAAPSGATGRTPPRPRSTAPVEPFVLPPRAGAAAAASGATGPKEAAPSGMSTVNIALEHKLKDGSLSVMIDGKEVYGLSIASAKKRGKDNVTGSFQVPDGRHEVRLCLNSPEMDDGSKCSYKQFAFVMNRTSTIRATHGKPPMGKHFFTFTIE